MIGGRAIAMGLVGVVLALGAVGVKKYWGRPNVILITIDTLRADHVGAYGHGKASTPNLDWVAAGGAVFERAYCDVTWTTPSMTSTMLGQFATRHGLQTTFQTLDDDKTTLAEMLNADGYATAAVIGSYPLSKIYNLDQGFESYDDTFTRPIAAGDSQPNSAEPAREIPDNPTMEQIQERNAWAFVVSGRRTDAEVSDRAIALLSELMDGWRPFFLWVHYFGPHHVPNSKLGYFEDFADHIHTYPRKTAESDAEVGRLLMELNEKGIAKNTLVIIHSDHGESLGEHEYVGHGRFLYEDNLRVPLLVRWPASIKGGTRSSAIVGNVDIASTILEATRTTPAPRPFDGLSLLEILRSGGPGHSELILETYGPTLRGFAEHRTAKDGTRVEVGAARFGVLRGNDKFIRTEHRPLLDGDDPDLAPGELEKLNRRELYDVKADPGELTDRSTIAGDLAVELERSGEAFRADHAGESAARIEADPEHSEKLRSLGYVE